MTALSMDVGFIVLFFPLESGNPQLDTCAKER